MSSQLTSLAPNTDLIYSSRHDSYEIIEAIGKGGTSTVYRARSSARKIDVAIKIFITEKGTEKTRKSCLEELLIVQAIEHPNIASTIDAGFDHGTEFIVMKLIEGGELEDILKEKPLTKDEFVNFATQILEAMVEVHARQVLHLDIKPINIMVSTEKDGSQHYRLIDFGASEAKSHNAYTHTAGERGLEGSVHFMSPEQINNEVLDERSDIYSLGCTFYQALTQQRPFEGDTAIQVIASHIQNRHTPLSELTDSVSPGFILLIEKMISQNREDRPASAQTILSTLQLV